MVRVVIKGGVWRNTEDEVLKAAVMKYGKNQWSRVASLLHRKSAKQCKARWFEWLDPSIKKTEWSRDEDEKLLHLAKLMPTQWRTIAPIVGRTASQCLERYEFLLDQAQRKADGLEDDAAADARKLKPGEIDPHPETKPARPDPVDMDEDELEMLSEARARLANTQGKKAKRKAREKQLEDARRLASLQKRREMQAAGMPFARRRKLKHKQLDLLNEIPFERSVPAGFHDPDADHVDDSKFEKKYRHELDPHRRDEKEIIDRRKDKDKLRNRREKEGPDSIFAKSQPDKKRSKLVLPPPQVSESELEQIVKMGRASNAAREAADASAALGGGGTPNDASRTLLSEYSFTPAGQPASVAAALGVPRTPQAVDNLQQEAANLLALTNVDTPLKGGENTPLVEPDFSSMTPRKEVVQTPNTLLKGMTPNAAGGDLTPMGSFTPAPATPGGESAITGVGAGTPYRDRLNINAMAGGLDPLDPKESQKTLIKGLRSLPAPKNDYEIVVPEEEGAGSTVAGDSVDGEHWVDDAADVAAQQREAHKRDAQADWARQSQAVQRGLPRPFDCSQHVLRRADRQAGELQRADEMIKQEMLAMLHYDALFNPTDEQKGKAPVGGKKPAALPPGDQVLNQDKHVRALDKRPVEPIGEHDLNEARRLVQEECEIVSAATHGTLPLATYEQVWNECYAQVLYVPSQQRYTRASMASKKDRIEAMEHQLEQYRQHMAREAKKASKMEKKLQVLLGGYQHRAAGLLKKTDELYEQLELTQLELSTFSRLAEHEAKIVPRRLHTIAEEVRVQQDRESMLQKRYDALCVEREQLMREEAALAQREAATVHGAPVVYEQPAD